MADSLSQQDAPGLAWRTPRKQAQREARSGGKPDFIEASIIDARLRELIIMRIGWRQGSVYEWTQHWRVARMLEIPEEDLVAVRDWKRAYTKTVGEGAADLLDLDFALLSDWNGEATRAFGLGQEVRGLEDLPDESVERVDESTVRIDGTFPIDDFNEQFAQGLPQEDFHTLAGFVFGELGRVRRAPHQRALRRHRAAAGPGGAARRAPGAASRPR